MVDTRYIEKCKHCTKVAMYAPLINPFGDYLCEDHKNTRRFWMPKSKSKNKKRKK